MPRKVQTSRHILRQTLDAELCQHAIQHAPMQYVEFGESDAPRTDLFHSRLILRSPSIREGEPIQCKTPWFKMRLRFPGDASSPINQSPEYVKK